MNVVDRVSRLDHCALSSKIFFKLQVLRIRSGWEQRWLHLYQKTVAITAGKQSLREEEH